MPDNLNSLSQQIGEMRATINFTAQSMRDVTRVLEENRESNTQFREFVIGKLSGIDQNVVVFAEYKTKCEDDRENLDGRTQNLETWRIRQAGQMSVIVALALGFGAIIEAGLHGIGAIKEFFR